MTKSRLTITTLREESSKFSRAESKVEFRELFGTTDGKTIGTHLEKRLFERLRKKYSFTEGNAASGIDFPKLKVDVKVTKLGQPQSSSPFKTAEQKVYGLGYNLLIFAYEKFDNRKRRTGRLQIESTVYVESDRTADFQLTSALLSVVKNEGNQDDIFAMLQDRNLSLDSDSAMRLAERILREPPKLGCLTISNALQWRLGLKRVIDQAGSVSGVHRLV